MAPNKTQRSDFKYIRGDSYTFRRTVREIDHGDGGELILVFGKGYVYTKGLNPGEGSLKNLADRHSLNRRFHRRCQEHESREASGSFLQESAQAASSSF